MDDIDPPAGKISERQQARLEAAHLARRSRVTMSSNATARATAQASIPINGGAATAVLAFLAKGTLPQSVFQTAAACLGVYALGVAAGACMMYCTVRSLDYYSLRWRLDAHPEEGADAKRNRRLGERWWKGMKRCFYASMAAFIISSVTLATVLLCAKSIETPTKSTVSSPAPSAQ